MMLTGQVFTIMNNVATNEQVSEITKAADCYLYCNDMEKKQRFIDLN